MKSKATESKETPSRKVVTSANYKDDPNKKTVVKGKSLTVQGEAISVATMLKRLQNGMPIGGHLQGNWAEEEGDFEDLDLEKFVKMDRFDQEMIIEGMKAMGERLKALKQAEIKDLEPKEEVKDGQQKEGE